MATNFYAPTVNPTVFGNMSNENGFLDEAEVRGTTSLPTDTQLFSKGCTIKIEDNGEIYINTAADGDAPSWVAITTNTNGITQLTGDVTAGPGSGSQAATIAVVDLEAATLTNIANTEILIGTGAGTGAFAALSGDATMTNAGVVSVTDLTITGQAAGDILYFNGTNWVKLAIGTAGQVLTVNAGATAPEWA